MPALRVQIPQVLGMLGIEKTDDMLELEKKKSETMMAAVNKIASLLTRKKSPAELSKTKWTAVAKLYRQGKLTCEAWQFVEEGGDMSTFGQPKKRVSWCSAKFDVDAGCSAKIRAQFEPQYNEFSKVAESGRKRPRAAACANSGRRGIGRFPRKCKLRGPCG